MREPNGALTEKTRLARGVFFGMLALLVVSALKLVFHDALGAPTPFLLYFGASVLAAWYGGFLAGALITGAGGLIANVLFMHPLGVPTLSAAAIAQTGAFFVEGAI